MPKQLSVGASSLADLKNELFRKQAASKKAKAAAGGTLPPFVTSDRPMVSKEAAAAKEAEKSARGRRITELESRVVEEERQTRTQKAAMERKAALYDQLKAARADPDSAEGQLASNYLVNFDLAASAERNEREEKEEKEEEEEEVGDWVEFTDAFGRQRRCLRQDLRSFLSADDLASKRLEAKEKESGVGGEEEGGVQLSGVSRNSELLSRDMDRELERREWEGEASSTSKGPATYQSVLGGEAREHGVAYYEFSKDEAERKIQMEELNALRNQTVNQRSKASELRAKRAAKMEERLAKVAARKRLRTDDVAAIAGVEEEEAAELADIPLPGAETEGPSLRERLEKELKEADERIRERQRDIHVRDWDRGKPKFSQEQWVEEERKKRPSEFAPPSMY